MTACVIVYEQFPHQMEEGIALREKTRGVIRKWNEEHKKYLCVDKVYVKVTSRTFILC